jgi:ATP-dependent DNA helicase RecQ
VNEALLQTAPQRLAAAYTLAWLRVAGANSVLPPWVRLEHPLTGKLIGRLREAPCAAADCAYCRQTHNARAQLRAFFGFDDFRPLPANRAGGSLQQEIVQAGLRNESLLAILPTGGGKSLCYQLPALARNYRRGVLTIVISPLQALMKDQVDGLVRRTGTPFGAALYGLLTPPERGDVLRRIRLGDVALLYVSPEQLRNRSFREAIAQREIGCWVFDEAHCLSKWGHDFRPDYLYAGRFIREFSKSQDLPIPPIACFTATAKRDVKEEIIAFFKAETGRELALFEGGVERDNLRFEVQTVTGHSKLERVHDLLASHLPGGQGGHGIVFRTTRLDTEVLAEFLRAKGWRVAHFHAGLKPSEKKRIQDDFLAGHLQVICATNAFGMGIDKEDVRLVIHADTPGSLENYLQEAGRAGRDGRAAECILLYDEEDCEQQFRLGAFGELTRHDIAQILRGLRKAARGDREKVVITAGEILRDEDVETNISLEDRSADTKVRTAISWLERAGFIQRDENVTNVFQARLLVRDLQEAEAKMAPLNLPNAEKALWTAILRELMNAGPAESLTVDQLALLPEFSSLARGAGPQAGPEYISAKVLKVLGSMAQVGLMKRDTLLNAYVRHKVSDHSRLRLDRVLQLDRKLLEVLALEEPDPEGWMPLSLRLLNQRLQDEGFAAQTHSPPRRDTAGPEPAEPGTDTSVRGQNAFHEPLPGSSDSASGEFAAGRRPHSPEGRSGTLPLESSTELIRSLLKSLSEDGRGFAGSHGSIDLRYLARDTYRVRVRRSWTAISELAEKRRRVAGLVLDALLARIPPDTPPCADLLVEFSFEELQTAVERDLFLRSELKDLQAALERALMFLHEQRIIVLQQGLAVFRSAMTIRLQPEARGQRYTAADYQPLEHHYRERILQVHVMSEYARRGLDRIREALSLVLAYFTLDKEEFVRRYLPAKPDLLKHATTAQSYQRIVTHLNDPVQIRIVTAPASRNLLILAGPGSGKTRTVVHRCAYLLRVERVRPQSVLVCCFNRHAAIELRRRLAELAGPDARGVTVLTYHGLAMRLLGYSFAARQVVVGQASRLPAVEQASRLPPGPLTPETNAGETPAQLPDSQSSALRSQPPPEPEFDLDALIPEAVKLLRGESVPPGLEPDEVRDRLLAGFQYILVDEYQDIDEPQYQMISAIAGRTLEDPDLKLSILAVGDDDQNVYSFRGANVEFIRRFQQDYQAEVHYLVENYRSTQHIIAAANGLIASNTDRMKTDHPIRIDRRRKALPKGGAFGQRDELGRGKVQVIRVEDDLAQTQAVLAEIRRLRELGVADWSGLAVLSRTNADLAQVRALLEAEGLPVRWCAGQNVMPPLHQVRELHAFLQQLRHLRPSFLRAADLFQTAAPLLQAGPPNPWTQFLRRLLEAWQTESGDAELPVQNALEFFYEACAESRRDFTYGEGVTLSTVHSAKGAEYDHVLLIGAWPLKPERAKAEEERRAFYVGMTRARQSLAVIQRRDVRPSLPETLSGPAVLPRDFAPGALGLLEAAVTGKPEPAPAAGRSPAPVNYVMLGLDEIHLGYPGFFNEGRPVPTALARLKPGDRLDLRPAGADGLGLFDGQGLCVARLSRKGAAAWRDRLQAVRETRVVALVHRSALQEPDPARRHRYRVEDWEIPMVEVVLKPA